MNNEHQSPHKVLGLVMVSAVVLVALSVFTSNKVVNNVDTIPQQSAQVYQPTGTWQSAGLMPVGLLNHTAIRLQDGRILIAGGRDFGGSTSKAAQLYNTQTNTWVAAPSMGKTRENATSSMLWQTGKILVAGGQTGNNFTATNTAEVYNPVANSWTATSAMPSARFGHQAIEMKNGEVFLIGGFDGINSAGTNSVVRYNPSTSNFTAMPSMANRRNNFAAVSDELMENIWAIGGACTAPGATSVEKYNIVTNSWTPVAPLLTNRTGHKAVAISQTLILVVGGTDCSGNVLTSSEIYDTTTNTWTYGPTLPYQLKRFTLSAFGTGNVILVGGNSQSVPPAAYPSSATNVTYTFDFMTRTWKQNAFATNAYGFHTATVFGNNRVLVTGGQSGFMNQSEVFIP